ncbi:MAG: methyltransferase domain-containing protein [Desulfurococcales archaeon]|nr:methyltransferase domain-containing protein [Desulfurococcales archaeon]
MSGDIFEPGDIVLLVQRDNRKKYVILLEESGVYMTVGGFIKASDLLGIEPGSIVKTSAGVEFYALRGSIIEELEVFTRKSQVIYPKDLAIISMLLGVRPCMRMIQSGVGAGYSLAFFAGLLGDCGEITGVDLREDMILVAEKNMAKLGYRNVKLLTGNIEEVDFKDPPYDNALLDLPNPYRALLNIHQYMKSGARIAVYLPTISQVERLKGQLEGSDKYYWLGTYESWIREWVVLPRKTRPVNTPSSHTGFIVILARLI